MPITEKSKAVRLRDILLCVFLHELSTKRQQKRVCRLQRVGSSQHEAAALVSCVDELSCGLPSSSVCPAPDSASADNAACACRDSKASNVGPPSSGKEATQTACLAMTSVTLQQHQHLQQLSLRPSSLQQRHPAGLHSDTHFNRLIAHTASISNVQFMPHVELIKLCTDITSYSKAIWLLVSCQRYKTVLVCVGAITLCKCKRGPL